MPTEANKALIRSWFDVPSLEEWLRQRPEVENVEATELEKLKIVIPAIFAPEFIAHRPEGDMPFEGFVQYQISRLTAFPDFSCTVEDIIAEGQKVMVRFIIRGTHLGMFHGIPATGKKIEVGGIGIYRCAGGKIVEGWVYLEPLGMMQQLGVIPSQ